MNIFFCQLWLLLDMNKTISEGVEEVRLKIIQVIFLYQFNHDRDGGELNDCDILVWDAENVSFPYLVKTLVGGGCPRKIRLICNS